eukprot:TRINITY_DN577224_c0_g1_i1.p1 TRINITY_DN577224_c0_g1~~TRINITY_DN577224_c0_g1_i1.p1  ORF type:complete len:412 (+),score=85.74 TRINITY_DN577224_c0_g1_i1:162-1397(+)
MKLERLFLEKYPSDSPDFELDRKCFVVWDALFQTKDDFFYFVLENVQAIRLNILASILLTHASVKMGSMLHAYLNNVYKPPLSLVIGVYSAMDEKSLFDEFGHSILSVCVEKEHFELVEALLNMDPEVSRITDEHKEAKGLADQTALKKAVYKSSKKMVQLLLDSEKSPSFRETVDVNEESCLHTAVRKGDSSMIRMLVKDCRPELYLIPDFDDRNVLHLAASKSYTNCIIALMEHCPPELLTAKACWGTPLEYALRTRHEDSIRLIIQKCKSLGINWQLMCEVSPLTQFIAHYERGFEEDDDSEGWDEDDIEVFYVKNSLDRDYRVFKMLIKDSGWFQGLGHNLSFRNADNLIPYLCEMWEESCSRILFAVEGMMKSNEEDTDNDDALFWASDTIAKETMKWIDEEIYLR